MDELELISLAISALRTNFIRTVLTMMGVIIGIASVIIIMSLGEGATQSIVGEISSFGANVITVQAGRFVRGPGGGGSTIDTLVEADAKKISQLPNVTGVSGTVSTNKQLVYEGATTSVSITGVETSYQAIRALTLSQGSFFSDGQVLGRAKVLVVGDEKVTDIFGEGAQVVGESVRLDGKSFRIIGVVADSSAAFVPITTAQNVLLSQDYYNAIEVAVSDSTLVTSMSEEIKAALLLAHDIADEKDADFSIRSSQEIISSVSSVTSTLTAMLSGIAAISLVVGGIGIMNIMLVTVTERTREIGLLKAIGAKKKDILNQFLIEAIVVTVAGGIVGVVLGGVVTYIASTFLSIPFVISLKAIGLAIGVSVGVGIVFGWYPARTAANLQPIDALRYE